MPLANCLDCTFNVDIKKFECTTCPSKICCFTQSQVVDESYVQHFTNGVALAVLPTKAIPMSDLSTVSGIVYDKDLRLVHCSGVFASVYSPGSVLDNSDTLIRNIATKTIDYPIFKKGKWYQMLIITRRGSFIIQSRPIFNRQKEIEGCLIQSSPQSVENQVNSFFEVVHSVPTPAAKSLSSLDTEHKIDDLPEIPEHVPPPRLQKRIE
jgi:hypothetical protein